jgi:hypothetical protein
VKVSFNRPYYIDTSSKNFTQVGAGFFLRWEVMMVRWLERNGYDVTYCTSVDNHENSSLLLSHKGFLSVGHDEYWSCVKSVATLASEDFMMPFLAVEKGRPINIVVKMMVDKRPNAEYC